MFPARRHSSRWREEARQSIWLDDSRAMVDDGRASAPPKSARRVAFGAARCNGEAENLSDSAAKLFCSLLSPACLYRAKNRKNFQPRICRRLVASQCRDAQVS